MIRNRLILKVTDDEYELPLLITDTVREMSELTGDGKDLIYSGIRYQRQGKKVGQYREVILDDKE